MDGYVGGWSMNEIRRLVLMEVEDWISQGQSVSQLLFRLKQMPMGDRDKPPREGTSVSPQTDRKYLERAVVRTKARFDARQKMVDWRKQHGKLQPEASWRKYTASKTEYERAVQALNEWELEHPEFKESI